MTFDWTVVCEIALFTLICVVVAAVLPWIRERIGAERLNKIWRWVCWAVQAAEQLFGPGAGDRKKEYVLELLAQQGVEVTDDIDAMIEAAVMELTPTHVFTMADDEDADAENAEA